MSLLSEKSVHRSGIVLKNTSACQRVPTPRIVPGIMRKILFSLLCLLFSGSGCRLRPSLPGLQDPPHICEQVPDYVGKTPPRVRVVGVFTVWSLDSMVQASRFMKVAPRFDSVQVQFVAVFIDRESVPVAEWVASEKPSFRVVHDADFGICRRQVKEVPVTFILDSKNRVRFFYGGPVTTDQLHAQIREALKK